MLFLLFIFQEFTLKPVDLGKPEASHVYTNPCAGGPGDQNLLIELEHKTERNRQGEERSRSLTFVLPHASSGRLRAGRCANSGGLSSDQTME